MKKFLGLLAVCVVSSCNHQTDNVTKAPTRVRTLVVSTASSDATQTYVGIVEEREATAVSFTGMGVVKRVLVNEGQAVSRGQMLAEMDDTQARNLLDGAEAQTAQANDALERYKLLHDNGSLPEVQWVEIQSKVAQAKSQLEIARKNMADCKLIAPVGGIIGKKMVRAGETALPSQAVVTILDISSVKVKVAIPEAEISQITPSTPSFISVQAAQAEVNGGRIEKGVQADALTHTYEVRINVPNNHRKLLPGMVANVRFGLSPDNTPVGNALSVPVTTVQKAADGSLFVWTVSADSTAHRSKVSIAGTTGNQVTITEGLATGQRVVTEGYQKLSEGTRVIY